MGKGLGTRLGAYHIVHLELELCVLDCQMEDVAYPASNHVLGGGFAKLHST